MPDGLEYLVRPYQTPNAQGQIIIPATPAGARERATLTWGAKASMPERKMSTNSDFTVQCCNEQQDELDRDTETVRIYGPPPSDAPSYVDVARATTLRLKKKPDDQTHCIPDVTWFSGPTFSDGFEPQDDTRAGCKITLTLKNNTAAP